MYGFTATVDRLIDTPLSWLYPCLMKLRQRQIAFTLYIAGRYSDDDICREAGINKNALARVRKQDQWVAKRTQVRQAAEIAVMEQFKHVTTMEKLNVAERQLQIAAKLDKAVDVVLEDLKGPDGKQRPMDPEGIRDLAKAFKDTADVTARIVGICDQSKNPVQQNNFLQFNFPVSPEASAASEPITVPASEVTTTVVPRRLHRPSMSVPELVDHLLRLE